MATLTGVKTGTSNGDGTFSSLTNSVVPTSLGCTLGYGDAGDLEGDGKPDVVIAYSGNAYCYYAASTSPAGVAGLLGNGSGTFKSSTFVPFISSRQYKVSILRGLGDGTFDTANPYTIYSGIYQVTDVRPADVDGDGKMDLLMTHTGQSTASTTVLPGVLFAKGNGDVTFAPSVYAMKGSSGPTLQVGDFNGDGLPDFAVSQNVTTRSLFGLAVVLNAGNGAFSTPIQYTSPLMKGTTSTPLSSPAISMEMAQPILFSGAELVMCPAFFS